MDVAENDDTCSFVEVVGNFHEVRSQQIEGCNEFLGVFSRLGLVAFETAWNARSSYRSVAQ